MSATAHLSAAIEEISAAVQEIDDPEIIAALNGRRADLAAIAVLVGFTSLEAAV